MKQTIRGCTYLPGALSAAAQRAMVATLRQVIARAPFFTPRTRRGPMSVQMSAAGRFGWVSDGRGYRYAPQHPNGTDWPPIPDQILNLWADVLPHARAPECCLINLYRDTARMGLHQDRDEADLTEPVLSISLGDDALFRFGNVTRGGPTESLWLRSGDVLILEGEGRLIHHGVDRIRAGSSTLLTGGGRLNLTLRVVT